MPPIHLPLDFTPTDLQQADDPNHTTITVGADNTALTIIVVLMVLFALVGGGVVSYKYSQRKARSQGKRQDRVEEGIELEDMSRKDSMESSKEVEDV